MRVCGLVGLVLLAVTPAAAQPWGRPVEPTGRQVQAVSGDTVVVEGDDHVIVVRRRQASVRVVVDASTKSALVMADWGTGPAAAPDGRVNYTWRFAGIDGTWPLDARWEGVVMLMVPEFPPQTLAALLSLDTPAGVVGFVGGPARPAPAGVHTVIRYDSVSAGGRDDVSFDEAERDARSPAFRTQFGSTSFATGGAFVGLGPNTGVSTGSTLSPGPNMGTGGVWSSRMPRVIHRVDAEWPAAARAANVTGLVVLRVLVAADGQVRDAAVVRSIPLLDEAALAAVRQWRFEPAGPDGRPNPLAITVTVLVPASARQ